jgi:uncharacterized protein YacL
MIADKSALIDGRVLDLANAKLLPNILMIPQFIINELKNPSGVYDKSRKLYPKALDILAALQKNKLIKTKILKKDYPEIKQFDEKLILLAKDLNAILITSNIKLSKIAYKNGISVVDLVDLSNKLKQLILPGESMSLFVAKEGKGSGEGLGFLDDGTAVVVEYGKHLIGKKIEVTVTSILKTSSGRIIFSKPARSAKT